MSSDSPSASIPRVGFVSLGCPKALVDSEQILTRLRAEGYHVAPDYHSADLVVVNTCGFIDASARPSPKTAGSSSPAASAPRATSWPNITRRCWRSPDPTPPPR